MDEGPVTVVETARFIRQAEGIFSDDERFELIEHLAWNPEAGVVVPGTGGVRKIRWGIGGRGKSGGARVIYYYHNQTVPLFLLGVFAKNVKVDLTPDEKNQLRRQLPVLVQTYGGRTTQ